MRTERVTDAQVEAMLEECGADEVLALCGIQSSTAFLVTWCPPDANA